MQSKAPILSTHNIKPMMKAHTLSSATKAAKWVKQLLLGDKPILREQKNLKTSVTSTHSSLTDLHGKRAKS